MYCSSLRRTMSNLHYRRANFVVRSSELQAVRNMFMLIKFLICFRICVSLIQAQLNCTDLTFDSVPGCYEECVKLCTANSSDYSSICTCERDCDEELSCTDDDKNAWETYIENGCSSATIQDRCSACVNSGCSFCSHPTSQSDSSKISFCYDEHYGHCDQDKVLKKFVLYANISVHTCT